MELNVITAGSGVGRTVFSGPDFNTEEFRKYQIGFKLFRKRKDGTYGPLFINRKQKLQSGVWYDYEDKPTKGYAHRPGWHVCNRPYAPHLSNRDRVWCRILFVPMGDPIIRPESQGGIWHLASSIKIEEEIVPYWADNMLLYFTVNA